MAGDRSVMIASLAYTIVAYVTGNRVMAEYLLIPYIEGAGETRFLPSHSGIEVWGFLWFNTYPASVFMGDVGSLSWAPARYRGGDR